MKKNSLIVGLIVALFLSFSASAQEKQFAIEEVMTNPELYPQRLHQLQWVPETDNFSYVEDNSLLMQKADRKNYPKTLLVLEDLNTALKASEQGPLRRFPYIKWISKNRFYFQKETVLFSYDLKTKALKTINQLPEKSANADIIFHGTKIAYTLGNNVYIANKGEQIAVTTDTDRGILNGQAVHRNEWGIEKGTFWSPSGDKLAFYRMDERMVTNYPLVHVDPVENRVAEVENIKYPMAGMTSHQVSVGVYNMASEKTHFIQTGDPKEQFLTSVSWSPDEKHIYIAILNREQNHLKLNKYNAQDGSFIQTLFEEKDEQWVEPEHGMYFIPNHPDEFLWFSERDNWMHLYHYRTDGTLIGQLTKGEYGVTEIVGFDAKGDYVTVMATERSPIESHAYRIHIRSHKMKQVTVGKGSHSVIPNSKHSYFIDTYSSQDIPNRHQITNSKGYIRNAVLTSDNPLKEHAIGNTKIFTIKATNGDDLYCRIITPPNMDSTKKHPVFYYVYGGPHAQLVSESWLGGANLFMHYMAMQGYIVFTLDNHGTPNRGLEFEQAIHRNLGTIELEDQLSGVNYLKSLPFVDADRMGIQGWSYGGFMTISLMTKHPGTFKAAVAGGPVIDWKLYEIMYGERYMDTPEENPEGYKNANLLHYVDKLEGRLMLIHGSIDPTVVWQHGLLYAKEAVKKGILIDYFVYPEHPHNVRGKDRVHLYRKIKQYMDDHLK